MKIMCAYWTVSYNVANITVEISSVDLHRERAEILYQKSEISEVPSISTENKIIKWRECIERSVKGTNDWKPKGIDKIDAWEDD